MGERHVDAEAMENALVLGERNTSSNAGRARNVKITEVTIYFPDKKEFLAAE